MNGAMPRTSNVFPEISSTDDALGLAALRQRRADREAGDETREHLVPIAEVDVHRIREGPVVHRPSTERPGAIELDELAADS